MADNIKISEFNPIASGSLNNNSIIPVVDGGVTQKLTISRLKEFVGDSFATDSELSNAVSTINNAINGLSTTGISEGTNKYYTDSKVKSKLDVEGVLSGSLPAGYTLSVTDGTNSVSNVDSMAFYGATVHNAGNGDIWVTIPTFDYNLLEPLNTFSSSINIKLNEFTQSIDLRVDVLEGSSIDKDNTALNIFSGSSNTRLVSLETFADANDNSLLNTFTGSFSSSVTDRVDVLEQSSGGSTISSSQQITDFGFISSSQFVIKNNGTTFSSKVQSIDFNGAGVSGTETDVIITPAGGGGGGAGDVTFNTDFHIVSQSVQSPEVSNIVLEQLKLGSGTYDFKFRDFSASLDSRFGSGGGSDYISNVTIEDHFINFTGIGNAFNTPISLPQNIISSSGQIGQFGYVTQATINSEYIKNRLPYNVVSSSNQINDLGFVTNAYTESFALADRISGSFTELSQSLSDRVATNEGSTGITEVRLGEVTQSMFNGEGFSVSGNPITLISSSAQISYPNVSNLPYFIGDGVTITSGSDSESIPYFNLSTGDNQYILNHTASINFFTASISQSVDADSIRLTTLEADVPRIDNLEALSGSNIFHINEINSFTGSFSASVADDINTQQITDVALSGTDLVFTGAGGAFDGTVDMSSLGGAGTGTTESNYGIISQSYNKAGSNLELANVLIGGISGDVNFAAVSTSLETRISSFVGADTTTIAVFDDVNLGQQNTGDILIYDGIALGYTSSKVLVGDYILTGSLDSNGSINVSGSVTAESFIAGDVGTPIISAATNLEIDAGNSIEMTAGVGGLVLSSSKDVTVNDMLTIAKTIGNPTTAPSTGSMMNSGSIDSDSKLWFYNGTEWKEVQFV